MSWHTSDPGADGPGARAESHGPGSPRASAAGPGAIRRSAEKAGSQIEFSPGATVAPRLITAAPLGLRDAGGLFPGAYASGYELPPLGGSGAQDRQGP
jgi:hypothetical protein